MALEESDPETLGEVAQQAESLKKAIDQFSLDLMLDGKDDAKNAIVSINAGAGGTEAQDWAEMLFRMYTRWVAFLFLPARRFSTCSISSSST